ncbi:MAG: hypothetical protein KBD31_00895 [Proteobacteria bacterium]|nr:hypothetical protein [Pseudomonadota bacterium]
MIKGTTLTFTVIAMLVGMILFRLKYEVLALENTHHQIQKSIEDTKESIHVLRAEWAHLTDPSRIQKLSAKYLNNGAPISTQTIEKVSKVTTRAHEKKKESLQPATSIDKKSPPNKEEVINDIIIEKDSIDNLLDESSNFKEPQKIQSISYAKTGAGKK